MRNPANVEAMNKAGRRMNKRTPLELSAMDRTKNSVYDIEVSPATDTA
jgi:hypothetical protein